MWNNLSTKIAQLSPNQRELLKQKLQELKKTTNDHHKVIKPQKCQNKTLSFSQERIWFLEELESGNPIYNRSTNIKLTGKLNIPILEQSLNEIIDRHEALRTSFSSEDGRPQLVIAPQLTIPLPVKDLTHLNERQKQESLKKLAVEDAQKLFNLSKIPLIRGTLLKLREEEHILLLAVHHIVFDGWSAEVFLKEIVSLYEAFCQSKPSPLAPLSIQYQDFAQSQKEQIKGEKLSLQLNYWKKQLGGELPILQLPTDYPRPKKRSWYGASYNLSLSKSLTDSLKDLSQKEGVTLFMTLLAAFQVLLYRYTSQDDILVGSPIAGRDNLEIEDLIGVFINTLVFRSQLSGDLSFQQLLTQIRQVALEAYSTKDVPFEKLVEELQPQRDLSITPIFQVFFQLRSFPQQKLALPELTFDKFEVDTGIAPFDLTLDITEIATGLVCKFQYNTDLFAQATIVNLARHFQNLLAGIVANSQQKISHLPLLTPTEKQQILIDWNNTKAEYPRDKCIHQLFEEQVAKTPEAIAVVFEEQQLTYQQLNEKANQLADDLQKLGVRPNQLVGICMERSLEMVMGLLGILKSGGAYVPLDPHYPQERISYVVKDSQMEVLLTQPHLKSQFSSTEISVISWEKDLPNISCSLSTKSRTPVNSKDLAYVIYTSGSTGKPKGVQIEHKSVVNFLHSLSKNPGLTQEDRLLAVTSISFDIAGLEIYLPLSVGAKIILASQERVSNGERLVELLQTSSATIMQATPATWRMLLAANWKGKSNLKILCGGEALANSLGAQLKQRSPWIWNLYGPTETTIWSCSYLIKESLDLSKSKEVTQPIGQPIDNTQIYILDSNLQPVPIGVSGEIYIGGHGLARGYLNRPDLTAAKFISNPFDSTGKSKLYKTGDLARYLPDGKIEFLGRIDNQVKIRGFRLELGEIEANLNRHPKIRETVVIVRENHQGDPYLTAYVMAKEEQPERKELRQFLAQKLPEYMIPAAMVFVDAFPLTPNGKIDRKALPQPDWEANRENEFIFPRNETEMKLAGIWQELLGIKKVGIKDNFFALGGHSLLATQVVSRIRHSFQVELPLRNLFEFPTIEQLALKIEQTKKELESISIPVVSRPEKLPLSFAQERLWFINQLEGPNPVYNLCRIFQLEGQLNLQALEKAIAFLFKRHESLRTNFENQNGQPVQIIHSQVSFSLPIINLENFSKEEEQEREIEKLIKQEKSRCFDLEKDTLIRFSLLKISPEKHILIISMHHIITDGWSLGILSKELSHLYQAYNQNQPINLPDLGIQYLDFAIWQREYLSENILPQKISYWQEKLENAPTVSTFPTDYPRPTTQTFTGAKYSQLINQNLSNQLENFSQQKEVTLFITLLTAFKVLLYRHTEQEKLIVGFPIAGRNNLEIEKLIGFFANTLLIASNLEGNLSFLALLNQVKNCVFKSYENQDLPFEKLIQELQVERNLSHNPLFQIWFNLVNIEAHNLELEGLKVENWSKSDREINSKFDLTIYLQKSATGLQLTWLYNRHLYRESTINWLAQQYHTLLEEIIVDPERKINEIPLLNKNQIKQLFNYKNIIKPENYGVKFLASEIEQSIPERFEKQVQLNPEKIAIKSKNQQWSYQQLNQKTNQIAHQILSLSSQQTEKIALLFEHDLEMILALLAVLKTGKIYVPLDVSYPQERLTYILEDSQANLLLTNTNNYDLANQLTQGKIPVINVGQIQTNVHTFSHNPELSLNPDTIAYILYTSGSTGKPKGVVQNHRNILHFIRNYTNKLGICASDRISLLASYSFDAAVMDIFGTLLNGATLCLYDLKANGINQLPLWLREEEITIYHSTPTLYRYLLQEISPVEKNLLSKIRFLVLGGEEVVKKDVELYRDYFRENCLLINGYGSTESSFNLHYIINQETSIDNQKLSIGYAFENTEILLLDEQGNNTQICGEIAIKSEHVALGYWQQPALTKKVFLADSENSNQRIYRTGDGGRLRSDGTIEFLGRKDFQIKIRGIRLELGEIEAHLNQHTHIKENVVIARKNHQGEPYLTAYLIAKDEKPEIKELRQFLAYKLPEYMIPTAMVFLDSFPLTPNGKIDRKALPEIDLEANRENKFILPRNETEMKLAGIWQELLGIKKVGIKDNFFALGGHSLLATQVVSRIRNTFGIELSLRCLFESPTIEQLNENLTALSVMLDKGCGMTEELYEEIEF